MLLSIDRIKQLLVHYEVEVPSSEVEVRRAAWKVLKEEDLLAAFSILWNKEWQNFTKEDWQMILTVLGNKVRIKNNIGAFMACLRLNIIL